MSFRLLDYSINEQNQLSKELAALRAENEALRKERYALAAGYALIVKDVLAHLTTTKESPQWTTVDFNYMVKGIRLTLTQTDPTAILSAHDSAKDAEIAALSAGLRLAHDQMCGAGFDQDEIERTCGLDACKRALEEHDAALTAEKDKQIEELADQISIACADAESVGYYGDQLDSAIACFRARIAELEHDAALVRPLKEELATMGLRARSAEAIAGIAPYKETPDGTED